MALHGNWIDLVILIFLGFYIWEGFKRGFLSLTAEMASFLISFIVALRFFPLAAKFLTTNFSLSHAFGNALGFLAIALIIGTLSVRLITLAYRRLPEKIFRSPLNRTLGFLPAALDCLILVAFVLTALISLPLSGVLKSDILASKIGQVLVKQTRQFETTLNGIFGGAVEETLNFLTVKPGSSESIDLHFKTSSTSVDPASEQAMFTLVNSDRTKRGLTPFKLNSRLRDLARAQSQDMFARGYFSHVNPDGKDPFARMHEANIDFLNAGENLAYAPSVQIAHDGLMNSPGHRANILSPDFGHLGIGVIDGGIYGKMLTQEFTD